MIINRNMSDWGECWLFQFIRRRVSIDTSLFLFLNFLNSLVTFDVTWEAWGLWSELVLWSEMKWLAVVAKASIHIWIWVRSSKIISIMWRMNMMDCLSSLYLFGGTHIYIHNNCLLEIDWSYLELLVIYCWFDIRTYLVLILIDGILFYWGICCWLYFWKFMQLVVLVPTNTGEYLQYLQQQSSQQQYVSTPQQVIRRMNVSGFAVFPLRERWNLPPWSLQPRHLLSKVYLLHRTTTHSKSRVSWAA